LYYKKGDLDKAMSQYRRALKINPDFKIAQEALKITEGEMENRKRSPSP
jgi:Tfp pilus assembly protein PilF